MKKLLMVFATVLLFTVSAYTQKIPVTLDVQAKDKTVEKELTSYFGRELRSLGDVKIVKEGFYKLRVLVTDIRNKDNFRTGYSISVLTTQSATCTYPTFEKGEIRKLWQCDKFYDLNQGVIPSDGLSEAAKDFVTKFDIYALASLRPNESQ